MARKRNATPAYHPHPTNGRGRAVWTDANGVRHFRALPGPHGSPESRAAFARLLLELAAGGTGDPACDGTDTTVNELCAAHAVHAEKHYRRADGSHTHELDEYRALHRMLRELYGHDLAAEFGPLKLKALRVAMLKRDWCRSLVNQRIGRVKRIWKWGTSEELVPVATHAALETVSGLQAGRTDARESEPVRPVADDVVDATLPELNRHVAGMVELQRNTGMRPGEVCIVRRCDIDTGGKTWLYKPAHHKLAYKNRPRVVAIGPKAQEVLKAFFVADLAAYLFSPKLAAEEHHAERGAQRVTPRYPSHMKRNANKRTATPKKQPKDRYDVTSYNRAIARAVSRVNRERKDAAEKNGTKYVPLPHWHANQLRHNHATKVRKEFGIEAAGAALGHSKMSATEVYAERDAQLALHVAAKIG